MSKSARWLFLSLLLWTSTVDAQSSGLALVPDVAYADYLYSTANYKSALKEYLRVYFHDHSDTLQRVKWHIADCFEKQGDQKNAIKYYNSFLRSGHSDTESLAEAAYAKLRLLTRQNTKLAKAEALTFPQEYIDLDKDRYQFYAALVFFEDKDFDASEEHFDLLSYRSNLPSEEVEDIYAKAKKNVTRKHVVARFLSFFVPGLGQAVNGDWQDGANSALINSSLIALFFHVSSRLSLADALISVVPYLGRFYLGGARNAELASVKKQQKTHQQLKDKLVQLIQTHSSAQ